MKRYTSLLYFLALILVAVLAVGYFHARPGAFANLSNLSFEQPCSRPLAYTIGTIDPRFGLSKAQIEAKLAQAAALWNDAAGKTVLTYVPDDANAMPVQFVYDARQASVALGQRIDTTEASQDAERQTLESLQKTYLAAQQAYAAAVADFNSASQEYAAEVRQVNASGGADKETYTRLEAKQAALKQQQVALKAQGDALSVQATNLQTRIGAFNARVHRINQVVSTFNSTVGGEFEEGQFVRDSSGARHIDIYAYKSQAELLHSLTHEFGHSLGLDHNSNPSSIMFPYNKSGVTLSTDDIAALKAACKL